MGRAATAGIALLAGALGIVALALEGLARLRILRRPIEGWWAVPIPFTKHRVPLRRGVLTEVLRIRSGDALLVAGSPLFDGAWYRSRNPDVEARPLTHYLFHGAWEGRDPSAVFDSAFYLRRHPELLTTRENPLAHYLRHGVAQNLFPNRQFDPGWYLATYPDVKDAGVEPLTHYLVRGLAEGRHPNAGISLRGAGGVRSPAKAAPQQPAPAARAPDLPPGVANRDGPRLLMVDSVWPRPDRDSGSVTVRHLIEIFLQLGWQVTFFADAEMSDRHGYARRLEELGVRVLTQPPGIEPFLQAEGAALSLAMLFRVHSGGRHYEAVRRHCPEAKVVFETVDLHFLREEREAQLRDDQRALNVARATRERELHLARSADVAIVVSEFERELLEREVPGVRAMTLPLILDCPGRTTPFTGRKGVAFIGGYLHKPNIDAVHHFLDAIWPAVVQRLPSCVFHIVGSDLPDELKKRAGRNVEAVGYVKDLDAFLGKVRLTVAPLRYGAGVKGKVGSSLAAGVPCVGTSIAAEGMGLEAGTAIAVADDPREFAQHIVELHEDADLWTRMSDAGWKFAAGQFSPGAARRRIEGMLKGLGLPLREADSPRKAEAG